MLWLRIVLVLSCVLYTAISIACSLSDASPIYIGQVTQEGDKVIKHNIKEESVSIISPKLSVKEVTRMEE